MVLTGVFGQGLKGMFINGHLVFNSSIIMDLFRLVAGIPEESIAFSIMLSREKYFLDKYFKVSCLFVSSDIKI